MKNIFFLLVFGCLFFLPSCEKEKKDSKSYCFELIYPINLEFPDGVVEILDEKSYKDEMEQWIKNNEGTDVEKPIMVYPLDVKYEDGKVHTVGSEEELVKLKKLCEKEKKDAFCFKLAYPISYEMPDGSILSGDEKTLETDLKAWYVNNPEVEEKPELVYPVDVIFKDESTKTIGDEDAMIQLKKDCK